MMYDCAVRVPLIMRWPGAFAAGARARELVQWIDLAPTFLDAAGLPPLPGSRARACCRCATGDRTTGAATGRCASTATAATRTTRAVHTTMLRHDRWKLVVHHGAPATARDRTGELYDLDADPDELANLWDDPATATSGAELQELLLDVLVAHRGPQPAAAGALVNGENVHEQYPRPQLIRPQWQDLCGRMGVRLRRRRRRPGAGWRDVAGPVRPDDHGALPARVASCPASTTPAPPGRVVPADGRRRRARPGQRLLLHFGAVDYTRARSGSTACTSGGTRAGTPRSRSTSPTRWCPRPRQRRSSSVRRTSRRRRPSRAASRTGATSRTASSTTAPPGSGSRSGWRPCRTCTSRELHWTPDVAGGRRHAGGRALPRRPGPPSASARRLSLGDETLAEQPCASPTRDAADGRRPPRRHQAGTGGCCGPPRRPDPASTPTSSSAATAEPVDAVDQYSGCAASASGRPVPAQRPALLPAAGAGAGLLAASRTWPRRAPDALRREVELIKELGFNGVRVHQKVEDPRFLYWCDRLGLLVWGEMASAFEFAPRTRRAAHARVDGGRAPRPQPPVRRDLGAAERELGRPAHRRDRAGSGTSPPRSYHLTKASTHPTGDLQRRLGAHRRATSGACTTTPPTASRSASGTARPRRVAAACWTTAGPGASRCCWATPSSAASRWCSPSSAG